MEYFMFPRSHFKLLLLLQRMIVQKIWDSIYPSTSKYIRNATKRRQKSSLEIGHAANEDHFFSSATQKNDFLREDKKKAWNFKAKNWWYKKCHH